MLKVRYDRSDGLIHTLVEGPSDREGVERYIYALMPLIEQARAEWGRCWHLVDATQLEIQSSEALNSFSGSSIENMEPTDRAALVMTSEKAIKQMQDMPSQLLSRIFRDMESAKAWILKGDQLQA